MGIYMGPWVWSDERLGMPCWHAPAGARGSLDLRSLAACGRRGGTPGGFGLFVSDAPLGANYEHMGDLGDPLTADRARRWASMLGIARLDSASVLDAIWDTMTLHASALGDTGPRPLDCGADDMLRLYLAGILVRERPLVRAGPHWDALVAARKAEYIGVACGVRDGLRKPNLHRMLMTGWVRKYRLADYHELLPDGEPDEPPVRPETTITEDFTRADGETIGNLLSWTEVAGDFHTSSNKALAVGSAWNRARAESDLSSANHYSQAVFVYSTNPATWQWAGPLYRYASAADTCYHSFVHINSSKVYIGKFVTGAQTTLSAGVAVTLSGSTTIRGSAGDGSGDTLKVYFAGALKDTITDSSIPGGTRCGIANYDPLVVANMTVDDFEAADLPAAGGGLLALRPNLLGNLHPHIRGGMEA